MRLAVIDCGTNTFNLLIMDVAVNSGHEKVFNTRIPVKLGEGSINKGYIGEAAYKRALDAIGEFNTLIHQHKAQKVLAFATSAVRDASNGKELVEEIKQRFEIEIKVIDGNKEAELIYLGIRDAVKLQQNVSLIMDIGGGSTEFILANKERLFWKHSFNIGAARLLQRFSPSDPLTPREEEEINAYLKGELQPLFEALVHYPATELVGSSGAFESIIEMIHGEMGGEALRVDKTEYNIYLPDHFKISRQIIKSTLAQRKTIKGLMPMRIDMIVISCLMIDFILKHCALSGMRVSTFSLKEGAVVDFMKNG